MRPITLPLMMLTYGHSRRLCAYEEQGVLKLPVFSDLRLANAFTSSFEKQVHDGVIRVDEDPVVQVCSKRQDVVDLLESVGVVAATAMVVYDPLPIGAASNVLDIVLSTGADTCSYQLDEAIDLIE